MVAGSAWNVVPSGYDDNNLRSKSLTAAQGSGPVRCQTRKRSAGGSEDGKIDAFTTLGGHMPLLPSEVIERLLNGGGAVSRPAQQDSKPDKQAERDLAGDVWLVASIAPRPTPPKP